MTALAAALVLCCAMVCGTVLAWQRVARRADIATLTERKVEALISAGAEQAGELSAMRRELESLRASVALRSV